MATEEENASRVGGVVARVPTIIVGDIHADFDTYRQLLRCEEARAGGVKLPSIQVGDYGMGRFSDSEERLVRRFHLAHRRHCFIRGNHDALDEVVVAPGYIADGTISGQVLFLGGADNSKRGVRAWEDTEMSDDDMSEVLNRLRDLTDKPDVVVSHDAPRTIAERLARVVGGQPAIQGQRATKSGTVSASRTRLFLDEVYQLVQPSLWLFGHWHHPWAYQDGRTHFRCVGYHEAFTVALPW